MWFLFLWGNICKMIRTMLLLLHIFKTVYYILVTFMIKFLAGLVINSWVGGVVYIDRVVVRRTEEKPRFISIASSPFKPADKYIIPIQSKWFSSLNCFQLEFRLDCSEINWQIKHNKKGCQGCFTRNPTETKKAYFCTRGSCWGRSKTGLNHQTLCEDFTNNMIRDRFIRRFYRGNTVG